MRRTDWHSLTRSAAVAAAVCSAAGAVSAAGPDRGTPGWPDTELVNTIRFTQIRYAGRGWDNGLEDGRDAAANLMGTYNRLTSFRAPTAPVVLDLAELPTDPPEAPPFVYMTGTHALPVPTNDAARLRGYLLRGGILWADCGHPAWDAAFRLFMKQIFPTRPLLAIAADDPLFLCPFAFTDGAPPLWHHGGRRMLGIRDGARWMVYYHPGGLNDAWCTGHSGLPAVTAEAAMNLGINLLFHTIWQRAMLDRGQPAVAPAADPADAAEALPPRREASEPEEIPTDPLPDEQTVEDIVRDLREFRRRARGMPDP